MATRPKTAKTRLTMAPEDCLSFGPAPKAPELADRELCASGQTEDGAALLRNEGLESGAGEEASLKGLRILVVEDEFLLALEVEAALTGFGCSVTGPFAKLAKALDAARRTELDGAVLDINLNGEMVYPLAEYLHSAGVPFVFLTGYVPSDLPERFRHFRRLPKPLHAEALRQIIMDMRCPSAGSSMR
jgi:two-component system, response regulator PdtaR